MSAPTTTGRVHDLREPSWGHNWSLSSTEHGWHADRATVAVWLTPMPVPGDTLLVDSRAGEHRLLVEHVRRCRDPWDMAFVRVREVQDRPVRWWERARWALTRKRRPA